MSGNEEWEAMGIPMAFGKQAKKKPTADASRFDKSKRVDSVATPLPTLPPPPVLPNDIPQSRGEGNSVAEAKGDEDNSVAEAKDNEANDDESDDDEETDDMPTFPITHEIQLKDHTKVVSALTLDPSGARILSGSHDYDVKVWDFGGMGAGMKPFRSFEPAENYYVNDLKYSNAGDHFLVISGTTQPKLYDRDGEEKGMFMKGDPYLRDMKNTAGHVGEISSCWWHPKDSQTFITSSADSTIRIWDVENRRKQKTVIVVKSKDRGARTKVTSCAYSGDGKYITGVCSDGALHVWGSSSNFVRPDKSVEGAHVKGSETGSVIFSLDGRTILTRGGDHTVKLWDIRAFKKPLQERTGLPNLYPTTNAIFSPDEKYVLTGTGSNDPSRKAGKLVIMKRDDLEVVKEVEMASCVVKVFWHSKINQIVTGNADGSLALLYSPLTSTNGAKLLTIPRARKKATIEDASAALLAVPILTPHALPMFRDGEVGTKRKREKDRNDPRKSRRPDLPVSGPGRGGRVGASATQHVVQHLVRDSTRDEDPREALLKYAEVAEQDPQWTAAWRVNQPKPVFREAEEGDGEDGEGKS